MTTDLLFCLGKSSDNFPKLVEITEFPIPKNILQTGETAGMKSKLTDLDNYALVIKVSPYDGVIAGIKSQDSKRIISGLQKEVGEDYKIKYNSEKEQIEWSRIK